MNKDAKASVSRSADKVSRRRLLKAITAGGATAAIVPTEWTKPALKSVMLSAHAQATGLGQDGCAVMGAWGFQSSVSGGRSSFSMSVNGRLQLECGQGIGTVSIYRSDGSKLGECADSIAAGSEAGWLASFSCSGSFNQSDNAPVPKAGEQITVMAEFDNGCSCVTVTTVQ